MEQFKKLNHEIDSTKDKIESLREMAKGITHNYGLTPVNKSAISDKIANAASRIVDLEHNLTDDIEKLMILTEDIIHKINLLPDPDMQRLITLKYFEDHTWEQIAEIIDRSVRWVYEEHTKALIAFDEILHIEHRNDKLVGND